MRIQSSCTVQIDFELHDPQGKLLESTYGRKPLKYEHGRGEIARGLERYLEGKKPGQRFEVVLRTEDAYGDRSEQLIREVDKGSLQPITEPVVGMKLKLKDDAGDLQNVKIVEVKGDTVLVDSNHPYAGQTLRYAGVIQAVRRSKKNKRPCDCCIDGC